MPMEWQTLALPLTAGVETKSDAKMLKAPRLARLENGIFTNTGRVNKRPGYTALPQSVTSGWLDQAMGSSPANIASARALLSRADQSLAVCDDQHLYTWVPAANKWSLESHGDTSLSSPAHTEAMVSVVTSYFTPQQRASDIHTADRATISNGGGTYTLLAHVATGGTTVNFAVIDGGNGATVYSNSVTGSRPRCLAFSGALWLFYVSGANLVAKKITVANLGTTSSPEASTTNIATDVNANAFYDVELAPVSSGVAVIYNTTTANTVKTGIMSSTPALASVQSYSPGLAVTAVAVAVDPVLGQIASVVGATGGATCVSCRIYTSAMATVTTQTVEATDNTIRNITACWRSAISGGVYTVHIFYEWAGATSDLNRVRYGSVHTGPGVAAGADFRRHSGISSRAFRDGTFIYLGTVYASTLQTTYFLDHLDQASGGLAPTLGRGIIGRFFPGTAGGVTNYISHLPQVESLGSRKYGVAWLSKTRLSTNTTTTTSPAVFLERQIKLLSFDFNSSQSHANAPLGNSQYIAGSQVWAYDGRYAVESGFHIYPENVAAPTQSTASGSLVPGSSYSYRFYYRWTNASGEVETSSDFAAVSATVAAGKDTLTFTIPTLAHTGKGNLSVLFGMIRNVTIVATRTAANPTSASPFYEITSSDPSTASAAANGYIVNDMLSDTVTLVDKMSDATLASQALDYQNSGELDNVAPPAGHILAAGNGRLFLAGLEDPNLIWASKIHITGKTAQWNDALTIQTPEDGGAITAMAVMNGVLVVFKSGRIYAVGGDGPDNLGSGSFRAPELIASSMGCDNQRSVVLTPQGLMFHGSQGIWLLSQQLQLQYIGAPVESYNSQTITAATLMSGVPQVRFLCSSGKTLVYDYLVGEWSTFTNTGVGATVHQGTYYYADSSGRVGGESSSSWIDLGGSFVSLLFETGWIHPSQTLQGYHRLRSLMVLGDYKSSHTQKISVAYDYRPVPTVAGVDYGDIRTYAAAAYATDGATISPMQYTVSPSIQKNEAFKIRIEETGGSGESFALNEILVELGTKNMPYRISPGQAAT